MSCDGPMMVLWLCVSDGAPHVRLTVVAIIPMSGVGFSVDVSYDVGENGVRNISAPIVV